MTGLFQSLPVGTPVEIKYTAKVRQTSGEVKRVERRFLAEIEAYDSKSGYGVKVTARASSPTVEKGQRFRLEEKLRNFTLTPICPEMIWHDTFNTMCARPLKKPEQIEARLCGLHLGVQRRREARGAEYQADVESKRQAREELDAFLATFNSVCDTSAYAAPDTIGYGRVLLTVPDARQLMAHLHGLKKALEEK